MTTGFSLVGWNGGFLSDIALMANQSRLNATEVDPEDGERERKMKEVEAMLMEMRNRSSSSQRKMADREKKEAEKRNVDSHIHKTRCRNAPSSFFFFHPVSSLSAGWSQAASKRSPAGDR